MQPNFFTPACVTFRVAAVVALPSGLVPLASTVLLSPCFITAPYPECMPLFPANFPAAWGFASAHWHRPLQLLLPGQIVVEAIRHRGTRYCWHVLGLCVEAFSIWQLQPAVWRTALLFRVSDAKECATKSFCLALLSRSICCWACGCLTDQQSCCCLLLQQQRMVLKSRVLLLLAARSDQNAEQSMHALGCCCCCSTDVRTIFVCVLDWVLCSSVPLPF